MLSRIFFILCLSLIGFYTNAQEDSKWVVDTNYTRMQFEAGHMGISFVSGKFDDYAVQFTEGEAFEDNKFEVLIKTASVNSGYPLRDKHLRDKNFLNSKKYPSMTFKSTTIKKKKKDVYIVYGDLTLLGVTKKVALNVISSGSVDGLFGEKRYGFYGTTTISRTKFGMTFNDTMTNGFPLVSDDINISISIEFVKNKVVEY